MVFESLYESSQRGELILVEGGMCRFRIRKRDGVLVIYEIISTQPGAGSRMLEMLKAKATIIRAKCPQDLASNAWYEKRGFTCVEVETTRSGRLLNVWQLSSISPNPSTWSTTHAITSGAIPTSWES